MACTINQEEHHMRTRTGMLAALLLIVPAAAAAQARPALEAGTYAGLSVAKETDSDGSTKTISIPTGTLYLAFFPTDQVFIEPEISLTRVSNDGSFTTLVVNGWINVAPVGVGTSSVYIGGAPTLRHLSVSGGGDGDSASQWGIAGRVGYRILAGEGFAVRLEAGYERLLENDDFSGGNVFTLRVGLGGILSRST
jgi:hypothetical protein